MDSILESTLAQEIKNAINIEIVEAVLNTKPDTILANESFIEDEYRRKQFVTRLETDNSDDNVRQYFILRFKTLLYVCALEHGIDVDYSTWASKFHTFAKNRNLFEGASLRMDNGGV